MQKKYEFSISVYGWDYTEHTLLQGTCNEKAAEILWHQFVSIAIAGNFKRNAVNYHTWEARGGFSSVRIAWLGEY